MNDKVCKNCKWFKERDGGMSRLVKLTEDNVPYCVDDHDNCAKWDDCYDCPHFHDILVKLARYEEAEEGEHK